METLAEIDSLTRQKGAASPVLLEFKRQAGLDDVRPHWVLWAGRRLRKRWLHFVPLMCLLGLGATAPMFLLTLGLLLLTALGVIAGFMLFVQLPIGYLAKCWHGLRNSAERSSQVSLTRESSSGI